MDAHFGFDASAAHAGLSTWLEELIRWNKRIDLTAARNGAELADLMLADAYVLAKALPKDANVVDIGSGAGAPGLPLALLRPDLKMLLVEPLGKRVSFLRNAIAACGREDILLVGERGEATRDRGKRFDIAISRATLAPAEWLALGRELILENGTVWVLLAKLEEPGTPLEQIDYTWPMTGVARHALRY